MRTPMIPLIPLIPLVVVLVGCADTAPTAPTALSAARAAASRVALPFLGALDSATHTSRYDPATNTIHVQERGAGTATHLGRFALTSELVLDPATITGPQRMTLTAPNGDALFATGTVQGTPSADGLTVSSQEFMTITGGTGRFAGATGSFLLRQVNLAEDRTSSGAFTGTIALAR